MASSAATHATGFPANSYVYRSTPDELLSDIRVSASQQNTPLSPAMFAVISTVLRRAAIRNAPQDPSTELSQPLPAIRGSLSAHNSRHDQPHRQRHTGYKFGGFETVRVGLPRDFTSSFYCPESHPEFRRLISGDYSFAGDGARRSQADRKAAKARLRAREAQDTEVARRNDEARHFEEVRRVDDTHLAEQASDAEEAHDPALPKSSESEVYEARRAFEDARVERQQAAREDSMGLQIDPEESSSESELEDGTLSQPDVRSKGKQRPAHPYSRTIWPVPRKMKSEESEEDSKDLTKEEVSPTSPTFNAAPEIGPDADTSTSINSAAGGSSTSSLKINIKKESDDSENENVDEAIDNVNGTIDTNIDMRQNMVIENDTNDISEDSAPTSENVVVYEACSSQSYPTTSYPPASYPPASWGADSGYGSQWTQSQNTSSGTIMTPNSRIIKPAVGHLSPNSAPPARPSVKSEPLSSQDVSPESLGPNASTADGLGTFPAAMPGAYPTAAPKTLPAVYPATGPSLRQPSSLGKRAYDPEVDDEASEPELKKPKSSQ
ncbi:hypothetical protein NX059_006558 [Plenodomus lindquistii]|nr:hypothetical protein NX059_006558 [Plenodomus lindquistii]